MRVLVVVALLWALAVPALQVGGAWWWWTAPYRSDAQRLDRLGPPLGAAGQVGPDVKARDRTYCARDCFDIIRRYRPTEGLQLGETMAAARAQLDAAGYRNDHPRASCTIQRHGQTSCRVWGVSKGRAVTIIVDADGATSRFTGGVELDSVKEATVTDFHISASPH
jgi:hypothetical protein